MQGAFSFLWKEVIAYTTSVVLDISFFDLSKPKILISIFVKKNPVEIAYINEIILIKKEGLWILTFTSK